LAKVLTLELGETFSMETVIFLAIEDVAAYGQAEAAIQEAFNHLEQRIQQRTADLTQTIARLEQEIIERKRIEQALRSGEARLAGIIDIAVDAIISINADQRIILFNQGAEAIFGYPADEVIGKSLSLLIPPRYEQLHRRHVERFGEAPDQARHMRERSVIWGLRKNGSEFPAEASISKIHFQGEALFTVILRDVTERRRLEENLRLALAKEKELNELRSRFISMVSHELRTPLAVILSANQALETFHQQVPEAQRHLYHEHITQQVRHLTELLEDTLVNLHNRRKIEISS
jgi:PAS domain S-box-containing protein